MGPFLQSIVALAHQPVSGAERCRDGRECKQMSDAVIHQLENLGNEVDDALDLSE